MKSISISLSLVCVLVSVAACMKSGKPASEKAIIMAMGHGLLGPSICFHEPG